MRICEIRVRRGRRTRWVRAYQDCHRGPLCIDCAVRLHPGIRLDLLGGQDSAYAPVYEDDLAEMLGVRDAWCRGAGPPHPVLCSARSERHRLRSAQGSLDFGRWRR